MTGYVIGEVGKAPVVPADLPKRLFSAQIAAITAGKKKDKEVGENHADITNGDVSGDFSEMPFVLQYNN